MALGPPHLLAFKPGAADEVHVHLIPDRGPGALGIVVFVGLDRDPAHQLLHVRAPDELVGVFGEPGTPCDHRRRHRKLHAELGGKPGLRPVVAQDQRMGLAQRYGDPSDLLGLQRLPREQLEHRVERPMGAVAGRVFLDAETVFDDLPIGAQSARRALAIDLAGG